MCYNESMSSIFSEKTLGGLATFRKWLFRSAVAAIILGVVLGVIFILTANSLESAEAFGKTFGTMICIGIMLIFLNACSKLIESRRAVSQVFAIIGGVSSLLWVVFAILSIWLPQPCTSIFSDCSSSTAVTAVSKICSVFAYLSLFGVICGAILNMYEGKRRDVILPLKITAAVLAGYLFIYCTIITIIGKVTNERLAALAGFAAIVWFVVWIIAAVMSSGEKKKEYGSYTLKRSGVMNPTPEEEKSAKKEAPAAKKSDDELRAEIEEQVRREMIEKEVRARMEKELGDKKED